MIEEQIEEEVKNVIQNVHKKHNEFEHAFLHCWRIYLEYRNELQSYRESLKADELLTTKSKENAEI